MVYDVIVIGAGVTGALAARELSRYKLKVCVLEKESDVAMGASGANSAIVHAGFDAKPGTLKARFNVEGNRIMEEICRELDVPYKRMASLVLAFEGDNISGLEELLDKGIKNGVEGLKIIDRKELTHMEPNVSPSAIAALYAPTAGIVCPYELTLASIENAVVNGTEIRFDSEVKNISFENELFTVTTVKEKIQSRYIVNAAGIYSDKIAEMVGDTSFKILPRKGEYILLDKNQGGIVNTTLFQLPSKLGKGILVSPTVDGNLLTGPTATDQEDRNDVSVTLEGLEQVRREALRSVPSINFRQPVTVFAGLRARPDSGDFIIGASKANSRFINAAGIESPGLTSAPAIGRYLARVLKEQGLEMAEKENFNPIRKRMPRFSELDEKRIKEEIQKNPSFGRLICRCEKVTEAEVVDCIRRPVGARTVDGVKKRTRSGMGRCQGGFCSPRIMDILSRELGVSLEEITKRGGNSYILSNKTK